MKYCTKIIVLIIACSVSFATYTFGQQPLPNFPISLDTTVTTCAGIFLDSGGADGDHGSNEDFTITICSDDPVSTHIQILMSEIKLGKNDNEVDLDPVLDSLCFYDGNSINADPLACITHRDNDQPIKLQATANNTSGCITARFKSTALNNDAGWFGVIGCTSSCQPILADLISTDPVAVPADTGYIDICPGDEVSFSAAGIYPQDGLTYDQDDAVSTFEWNFGDGGTATGQNVTHRFDESGGYIVQVTITDQQGCTNTNFISQRVRVSTRPETTFTTDDNQLCAKDTINTSLVDLTPVQGIFPVGNGEGDTLQLPDGTGICYSSGVEIDLFSPGQVVTNASDLMSICVNMEHSWARDLEIAMICPTGKKVILHEFFEQTGTGIFLGEPVPERFDTLPGAGYDYCWTPDAENGTFLEFAGDFLLSNETLPSGDYSSFESFDNFIGCPLNGIWTLEVCDLWQWDNGYIFEWGIDFNPDIVPVVETFTPQIVDFGFETPVNGPIPVPNQDFMAASVVQSAGAIEHLFKVEDNFGCVWESSLTYEGLPPSHPDCIDCNEDLLSSRDTIVCEGAVVLLDATPQNLPERFEFPFSDFVKRDFGKVPFPQNEVFQSSILVNNVAPTLITDGATDIISICIDAQIDANTPVTIEVESPSGETIVLMRQDENLTGNFGSTCFTPVATESLASTTSPFTGDFQPADPWSDLDGALINGAWTLNISSLTGAIDAGNIDNWSITFQGQSNTVYQWTPSDGLSCDDCPNPEASPADSQQYIVEVSNDFGCTYRDTIDINIDFSATTLAIESVTTEPAACFSENTGSAEVQVSGGAGNYTFIWSDSLGQISQNAVFLEAGTYTVTVTDGMGCRATAEAIVEQPDSILVNSTIVDARCMGENSGQITIEPSGGTGSYTASWSNGASGLTNDALSAGSYTLTLVDDNGCELTDRFDITEPPTMLESAIEQTVQGCFGANGNELVVTAQGGTGTQYTFEWSDGQTAATATNLAATNQSVTVTDENGCISVSDFTPIDLNEIEFNIIQTRPTCFGGTDGQLGVNNLSGGAGATATDYNIEWSTGQTGDFVDNLEGGQTYSVTVTDIQGCETSNERVLDQPIMISFDIDKRDVSCFGLTDGRATVMDIRGENSIFGFQWTGNGVSENTATADNLPPGNYSVEVSDDRGCTATQEILITEPMEINLDFDITDNGCFGENTGAIVTTISGGVPEYTAIWSNGALTSDLSNLAAGTYSVAITDNNGCMTEGEALVGEPEPVDVQLDGIDPICFGDRNGQLLVSASGGSLPYEYSIDGVNFSSSSTLIGLTSGSYVVTVKDANQCQYTSELSLFDPPEFSVSVGRSDYTIVLGDSLKLSASASNAQGAVEYQWVGQYGGTLACDSCQTTLATPLYSIQYQLNGVDSRGCQASDMLRVFVEKLRAVAVPTGFTPNSDNVNDQLVVHGRPGTMINTFRVFDRWGELIFEENNFEVNSSTNGWDGTFRGSPSNSDTYLWVLEVQYADGSTEILRGQTNLIR